MDSKENLRAKNFNSEWKNKIAKLDTNLVNVLQGNKTITFEDKKENN